ncbi:hypothetical protein BDM02DRAFT_3185624 [Thelephora ganbajun]|uniref:Uncharacterized protein n=1 Tax=Thelephora ganbajun TaxID=370292 RepID=A0ACB6ZKZ8_THEGA|nr:hypothetical protein BDM02DRAFT_3185624 [Thelephora ganbajun]
MPRPSTRSTRSINNRPPSPPPPPTPAPEEEEAYLENLTLLRRSWKWAVFSQFYFTFAQLFAMNNVPISAIEDDLARSTRVHTPRVMHRLLYALTQDRKITIDNWQSSLRRQYARRDPTSNPIGFEPKKVNQKYILEPEDPQQSASVSVEPEQADSRALSEDKTHQQPKDEPDGDAPLEADLPPDPEASELKDWHNLPTLAKLDSVNLLIEWLFHNPYRVRSIMRDDDETAQWRIEPIGYDVRRNAYWLIGADRLWIQRSTYKPKDLKRKRLPAPKQPTTEETRKPAGKRRKVLRDDSSDSSGNFSDPPPREIVTSGPRAAKLRANKKLDAQAKALAEFQRENAIATRSTRTTRRGVLDKAAGPSLVRSFHGTRVSSRLRRGKPDSEEEWQSIPDGWLTEENSEPPPRRSTRSTKPHRLSPDDTDSEPDPEVLRPIKTGLEFDESVSDLTDLSSDHEDDPHEDPVSTESDDGDGNECNSVPPLDEKNDGIKPEDSPEEFIEWEMICSTLPEWERIPERFENTAHYSERALHKLLNSRIVPAIVADLREIECKKQEAERKRLLEEAVTHRKRSSRIAMKESEKEEARLLSQRKAEEAEKVSRAKRLEMRQQREEAERERKEREQRRRDHGPRTRANAGGRYDPRNPSITTPN